MWQLGLIRAHLSSSKARSHSDKHWLEKITGDFIDEAFDKPERDEGTESIESEPKILPMKEIKMLMKDEAIRAKVGAKREVETL